nr:protein GVQW3-like [Parasteatoda tepidariorum]
MSVQHVRKWCREFKNSLTDVHDEQRPGRPSFSDEAIAKVEEAMLKDRRVTARDLSEMIPVASKSCIHSILRDRLGYAKVWARWVPKMRMADYDNKRQRVEAASEFLHAYETDGKEFLGTRPGSTT